MPKNLVIVESPAKARTIERYLGDDYRVLASYGHVRDLPENPGKGKFGVDVDHDFAPEYVISDDRRKQVADDREGRQARRHGLPRHRPRPRGRGDRLARRRGRQRPAGEDPPGDVQRDHRAARSARRSRIPRDDRHEPRRRPADAPDRRPARRLHAQPAARRARSAAGLSAGRVQSVAVRLVVEREREIDAFTAREYWTIEALLATAAGDDVRRRARPDRRRSRSTSATARRPSATPRPSGRSAGRRRRSAREAVKRSPAPPFTTSTLQQEASRKLGFSPKRTMSIAQRLYEGVDTPGRPRRPDHLHANRLDRDGRRRDGRGARGDPRPVRRAATRCRRAASTRRRRRAPRRPTSRSARRASGATRSRWPATLKPEELRLYRLIWQRAIASQMAAKELETTTVELAAGAVRAARERDADAVRRLLRGLHRGPRRRRPRTSEERRAAGARRGRRDDRRATSRRPSTSPSRRRASPRRR